MLDNCSLTLPEIHEHFVSKDGTVKWLLKVGAGDLVEMVLIPEKGRNTLCVSSQVGCMLDCSFCSTGKQGFNGNLTSAEIVGQMVIANAYLAEQSQSVTNVVLMGMGEPLLNFDAVLPATNIMIDDHAFGLSKRRVTVSTAVWCRESGNCKNTAMCPWRYRCMHPSTNCETNWCQSTKNIPLRCC